MPAKINLKEKRFGYLTVLYDTGERNNGAVIWMCQCDCGKQVKVRANNLKSGNTISCGCKNSFYNKKDLTGKIFGKLKVVKDSGKRTKNKSIVWECLCECGNITYVQSENLYSGNTISCGCLNSKGEKKILDILKQENVDFKQQYEFFDLIDIKNLRFDFAIFKNNQLICLIEYQGEQHYDNKNFLYSDALMKHDSMKKEYCKIKNIPLIEIPYTDYSILNWDYLKNKINNSCRCSKNIRD